MRPEVIRESDWLGGKRFDVRLDGSEGFVLRPSAAADEGPRPCVWYAPTFSGRLPGARQAWIIEQHTRLQHRPRGSPPSLPCRSWPPAGGSSGSRTPCARSPCCGVHHVAACRSRRFSQRRRLRSVPRVATCRLGHPSRQNRLAHGCLESTFMEAAPSLLARPRLYAEARGGERGVPDELAARVGVLPSERMGQPDLPRTALHRCQGKPILFLKRGAIRLRSCPFASHKEIPV